MHRRRPDLEEIVDYNVEIIVVTRNQRHRVGFDRYNVVRIFALFTLHKFNITSAREYNTTTYI